MLQRIWKKRTELTSFRLDLELNRIGLSEEIILRVFGGRNSARKVLKPLCDMTMRKHGRGSGRSHYGLWEILTGIGVHENQKIFHDPNSLIRQHAISLQGLRCLVAGVVFLPLR